MLLDREKRSSKLTSPGDHKIKAPGNSNMWQVVETLMLHSLVHCCVTGCSQEHRLGIPQCWSGARYRPHWYHGHRVSDSSWNLSSVDPGTRGS